MPVLGVCRGMQVMNVALGGTLVQHLPDLLGHDDHRHTPGAFTDHEVRLQPGSLAARAVGAEQITVKSHHHQGIERAGRGVDGDRLVGRATTLWRRSSSRTDPFALGVLWHPEEDERSGVVGALVGRGAAGGGRAVIEVVEPATEQVMAEVPSAGADEVDAAVARAKQAFPAWRAVAPADRAALLHRLADALADRAEDLATLEARNAGKPIADARGEMGMVVDTFRYYAAAPERLLGQTIPVAGGVDMTFHEPLGVVGLIVPWNFPLLIASWKVAPALAAGNTVVLKPAGLTPLTALELERIALEAGVPEGVLNVVAGPGSVCGRRLVEHPDVAKIAFTGSTEVGRGIAEGAAATIKRVTLELGGKSANLVFADADLERAAAAAPLAVFGNAGQDCCARSRILVERPVVDRFLEALDEAMSVDASRRSARRGDPDGAADLGRPAREGGLASSRTTPRSRSVDRRRMAPATGSRRRCSPRSRTRIGRRGEEIFGPVACVIPFSDEREAVEIANDTIYGLSGSIWTQDGAKALRVARAVETRRAVDQLEHLGARRDPVRRLQAVRRGSRARARRARALHRRQERLLRHGGGLMPGGSRGRYA